MKKIKLSLLFACVILTACSSQIQATEALTETVSFQMEATEPLTPSTTPMTNQAIESMPAYEMLSKTSILSDTGILIEVREDTRITIDPIMGTQMEFGFRFSNVTEDQIPEHTMANSFSYFIEDIQFYRGEEEAPMKLEKTGGGGGGGQLEDGTFEISQHLNYRLPPDYSIGQEEHVIALVTFHESLGFSEPIRFTLDIMPMERPLG